jgi:hypothetical protein
MLSNLKIASHLKSRAPNFFIIGFVFFLFLFQSSFDKTKQSLKYLQDFSNSWDQGNVFGIGFPIENTSTYSINNFMVLAPYINKNSMPEWLASKNKFFINNSEFNKDEPITILSKGSSNIFTPITVDPVILYKLNSNFSLQISLNSSAKIASAQLGSLSIFPQIFEQKTKDGDFEYILTFMNPKIEETNTLLTINFIKNLSDNDVKLVFVDFKIDYLVKYYG